MKKLLALVMTIMMLMGIAMADSEKTPVVYDDNLTLNMVFPEGYEVSVEDTGIYKMIRMTKANAPELTLLICPDDEYADLERLNDMEEADQEGFVLSLMEDYHNANVTWLKTEHDTDVILLNENDAVIDYAELVTLYHGYLIDVQLLAMDGEVVTEDDVAMAMKLLSDIDFVYNGK